MFHVVTVDHGIAAWLHGIQAGVRETGGWVVTVPAEQSTQGARSDLSQLGRGELEVNISCLVPKPEVIMIFKNILFHNYPPITLLQHSELSAQETSQRGSHNPSLQLLLQQHSYEQVHVVRVGVELGQVASPDWADLLEVSEGVGPGEAAQVLL